MLLGIHVRQTKPTFVGGDGLLEFLDLGTVTSSAAAFSTTSIFALLFIVRVACGIEKVLVRRIFPGFAKRES